MDVGPLKQVLAGEVLAVRIYHRLISQWRDSPLAREIFILSANHQRAANGWLSLLLRYEKSPDLDALKLQDGHFQMGEEQDLGRHLIEFENGLTEHLKATMAQPGFAKEWKSQAEKIVIPFLQANTKTLLSLGQATP